MNTMKDHKEKINKWIRSIDAIKYDVWEDFAKETKHNFIRKQMSSEIVSSLDYQSQKKEIIKNLDFKNRPKWIKTNVQKSRYLKIIKDPKLRDKIYFPIDKDQVIFKCGDRNIIIPNKMLWELDLNPILHDFPDLKIGKDIVVKDWFPYFSLEAIDLIQKSGNYNVSTISDFREAAGMLSNTVNIESSYAYIPMICELFNFKSLWALNENHSIFNEGWLVIWYNWEIKGKKAFYALLVWDTYWFLKNLWNKMYYPLIADKK